MQRLEKRGRIWHGIFYENGKRVRQSTQCRDKAAAEAIVAQWERDAADPDHAAARSATLTEALQNLFKHDEERILVRKCAPATLEFHRDKAGHLVRIFETDEQERYVPFLLSGLRPRHVDGYVSKRRSEEVTDHTISKELIVLRKTLKLAVRAGIWRGRVDEVFPVDFSPDYEPRKRALTSEEVSALLAQLEPDRAACVAFIVATSACWGEVEKARREDVGEGLNTVHIRGTKRETRLRDVPMVLPFQRSLLPYAVEHAAGTDGMLFAPWGNVRRGLLAACERAEIAPCSPNDLRRTFGNWMVEAGVPLFIIAQLMGHKDTRMLERVYGRQRTDQLALAVSRALPVLPAPQSGESNRCGTVVSDPADLAGLGGLPGPDGLAPSSASAPVTQPKKSG